MDGESEWQGGTRHRLWQPEGKRIIAFWSFWICISGDVLIICTCEIVERRPLPSG